MEIYTINNVYVLNQFLIVDEFSTLMSVGEAKLVKLPRVQDQESDKEKNKEEVLQVFDLKKNVEGISENQESIEEEYEDSILDLSIDSLLQKLITP